MDDIQKENEALRKRLEELEAKRENEALKARLKELEEGGAEATSIVSSKKSWKQRLVSPTGILAVGSVAMVALALVIATVIAPASERSRAAEILDSVKGDFGTIRAVNTKIVTFSGTKLENANAQQKALSVSGEKATDPAAFIFSNGKNNKGKRKVDIYVDFNGQRSRDFVLMNQNSIKGLVENGKIDLYVHPVVGTSPLSIYAPEALAESFFYENDRAWDFFTKLLTLSTELQADQRTPKEIASAVAKLAKQEKAGKIDTESIQNGTFASWLLSVGNDPNLQQLNVRLPSIYIDGVEVDTSKDNINSGTFLSDELKKSGDAK